MATEEHRAPRISASAYNNPLATAAEAKPDVEWRSPNVNSVTGALDDLSCRMERLAALHWSNHSDVNDAIRTLADNSTQDALYTCWMISTTIGEKIDEIERLVIAITEAAYADRRAA